MTVVGFNVHRVIMALEKARVRVKQQQQTATNYEFLEEILEGIKVSVDDNKYNFQQYVMAAKAEGLNESETWKLAKETLSTHVSLRTLYRWAHEYLTEEAFMEVKQRAVNHRGLSSVATLATQLKEHIECESCVEAYEIDKIRSGVYSYEYLQQVAIWLHDCLELNCKGK